MEGNTLGLHHELVLLALHDQKGTLTYGRMIGYGLGGAVLTELLLNGRAHIAESTGWRRKKRVVLTNTAPTNDPTLDAAIQKMATARRFTAPSDTVARIAGLRGLWRLVATDLAQRGVLQETEQQILLLLRRRVFPTLNPAPERALVARVRKALESAARPDARTAALIGLADVTGTLSAIYSRPELRRMRQRIKQIREADVGSRAAREAVEAAMVAVSAAAAAATIAASG